MPVPTESELFAIGRHGKASQILLYPDGWLDLRRRKLRVLRLFAVGTVCAGIDPGTQQSLPGTEHVLAELGSFYPTVAYFASAEAGDEEEPASAEEQAEELDEVIFAGIVAMR